MEEFLKLWDTSIAIFVFSKSNGMIDVVVVDIPWVELPAGPVVSFGAEVDDKRASFSSASFTSKLNRVSSFMPALNILIKNLVILHFYGLN